MVRRVALAAGVPRFSTHTIRHLCLTDLARMGWEVHAIAAFAGHRSTDSTLQYIHLSGRDLAAKLNSSMAQIHAWRSGLLPPDRFSPHFFRWFKLERGLQAGGLLLLLGLGLNLLRG